jgi:hypothetical protein
VKLHAPVLSVLPVVDAKNAVVVHAETASATGPDAGTTTTTTTTSATDGGTVNDGGTDGGAPADAGPAPPVGPRAGRAFSLVPLTADLPARIQTTDAPPEAVVLSPTATAR